MIVSRIRVAFVASLVAVAQRSEVLRPMWRCMYDRQPSIQVQEATVGELAYCKRSNSRRRKGADNFSSECTVEWTPTSPSQFLAWTAEKEGNQQRPDDCRTKMPECPSGRVATPASSSFRSPSFLWPSPPAGPNTFGMGRALGLGRWG